MRCVISLSWLMLLAACGAERSEPPAAASNSGVISFVHLNDTYRIGAVEDGTRGGFGRVATVIRELKAKGNAVHVLHGGDFLYPSLESQLWNGQQMIEAFNFLNELAPMTVVAGNHEFDRRTPDALSAALRASEFTWLGGSVELMTGFSDVDQRINRYRLVNINGKTFGVFGLTLAPEDGGNARDYLRYASDYVDLARQQILELEAAGADLIIGLTHLHLENDVEVARLRSDHPRFVLIAGGHEHEPEHEPGSADAVEIVKGASNARSIWQIDVRFDADDSGGYTLDTALLELDANVPEDGDYQRLADAWRARLLETIPFLPAKIGEAAVPFDAREVTIRNQESNWGNFIADQMRLAFGEPPADLAFINSGTLRIDDYIAGEITFEDIARTFGFSSYLSYLEMNGGEFRTTLEAGFRGFGPSKGYFPQVSGFRVCVDRSRPEGSRIAQLQVPGASGEWQELDAERDYLVVAPDYLLRGGDGYEFPAHRPRSRAGSELKYLVLDAVVRAQAAGQKVGAAVDPQNPRIAFVTDGRVNCFD